MKTTKRILSIMLATVLLAAMTIPAVLESTGDIRTAAAGTVVACVMAWRGHGLLTVAIAACAAVGPDCRLRELTAEISAVILYDLRFRFCIRDKGIQCDNRGNAELLHVLDVLAQVDDTLLQCFQVLLLQVCLRDAAVVLQRLDARDNDGRIRL